MTCDVRRRRAGDAVALLLLFTSACALGHIKNEASQFPDIEFSPARFDIVLLVGAGIIPETPVFEPDKPLTRRELAAWAALARGLEDGGETPDVDALAEAALAAKLVDSLEGNATFAELNELFLGGSAAVASPGKTPTKAEAAAFIAAELDSEAGRALLERRGLRGGAEGKVVSVESTEGHHGSAYLITVGSVSLPMHAHGRVANGPTDLLQWQDRRIRRSFVSGEGEHAVWTYLEAEPLVAPAAAAAHVTAAEPAPERARAEDELLYWLTGGAVVLGLALFVRRRRNG